MKINAWKFLTALGVLIGIPLLMATWSAGNEGNQSFVTNGSVRIPVANSKIASDTAKELNKAEDKAEKRKDKESKNDSGSSKN